MGWKIGRVEDRGYGVSSNLPIFYPSSKPDINFLILLIKTELPDHHKQGKHYLEGQCPSLYTDPGNNGDPVGA